ncbi:MAG: LysM peptidoglycan-binding domain-containing protein [Planctomycetes bacterium]|nr:LysM peptidoglycan-binding domain-containing protein [Planctomycetota bacterium]
MRPTVSLLICSLVTGSILVVPGCNDGRTAPGLMIGADGNARFTSAENVQDETERIIERSLDKDLGAAWRSHVAIAQQPRYIDDAWTWPATDVAITLVGEGTPPIPVTEVVDAVSSYFTSNLGARQPVTVTVDTARTSPADAPAAAAEPAPAIATVQAKPISEDLQYTIQTGDSLEQLSNRYYGTPEHWRRILDANPGLTPEHMRTGFVITIPAAR